MKPTVNVVYLPGTNCQVETVRAFTRVGAAARLVYLTEVLSRTARLDDADIVCLPGGFSFGDHVGAGSVAALLLRTGLQAQLAACRSRLLLGICNGFQIAVRSGCFGSGIALKTNECGTFQNVSEQPHLVVGDNNSPWLAGLAGQRLEFPCAHGEGRFVYEYAGPWKPALIYPTDANPDGSMDGIAGITSADGLSFGLMNHPERAQDHPGNLAIFENGVRAAAH
jgi:phosphoribosylformylglycinamidine (FGAM) synthase-like amidotransferase family enzyme